MLIQGILILAVAVLALTISVAIMFVQLRETRNTHRASISLQLAQQMHTPFIAHALADVHQLCDSPFAQRPDHLSAAQAASLQEVIRFFAHIGELARRGIADDEVFVLMGATISEMWHASSALRRTSATSLQFSDIDQDNFDWLYVEWLNWDHSHRKPLASPLSYAYATPIAVASGVR